jgi:uncharacterized protein YjbI with pentapeptide repeats
MDNRPVPGKNRQTQRNNQRPQPRRRTRLYSKANWENNYCESGDCEDCEGDVRKEIEQYIKSKEFNKFFITIIIYCSIKIFVHDYIFCQDTINFIHFQFPYPVVFSESTHVEGIKIIFDKFKSPFTYKITKFLKHIDFQFAHFNSKADFNLVHFDSTANFWDVQFDSTAYFITQFHLKAEFSGTNFHNYAIFENAQFFGSINFTRAKFDSIAAFTGTQFHAPAYFVEVEFNSQAYFGGAIFDSSVIFQATQFHNLADFRTTQFLSLTDFIGVRFNKSTNFRNSIFKKDVYFKNAFLPNYFDFREVKTIYEIDFSLCRLDSEIIKEGERCNIALEGTDINKIKLNMALFKLWFPDTSTTYEQKISLYEKVLKKLQNDGFMESYEILDVEYKQVKYDHNPFGYIVNGLDHYWWYYGYDKLRIFRWTFILFIIFYFINFIGYEKLFPLYPIKFLKSNFSNHDMLKMKEKKLIIFPPNFFQNKIIDNFFFTSIIFFGLKLDISNFNRFAYTKKGSIFMILIILSCYLVGLICLGFIVNIIFTK